MGSIDSEGLSTSEIIHLKELDSEGRCIVTDHGAFVLFNVYIPALSMEEQFEVRTAVILSPKLHHMFPDTLILHFFVITMNTFQGDQSDTSAETKALAHSR